MREFPARLWAWRRRGQCASTFGRTGRWAGGGRRQIGLVRLGCGSQRDLACGFAGGVPTRDARAGMLPFALATGFSTSRFRNINLIPFR